MTYDIHNGTDFATPVGTRVVAGAPGVVRRVSSEFHRGGLKVFIDHGGGLVTGANHLSRALVRVGERVSRGQLVALLVGVDQHEVRSTQRRTVDGVQDPVHQPAVDATVPHRVGEADHVVQHDRGAWPQEPGQVHVEMAQVAHHHHVGCLDGPA